MSVVCISYWLQALYNDGEKTIEIPFQITLTNMEIVTRTVNMELKLKGLVLIAETKNKL
jgi:hypothetical protein